MGRMMGLHTLRRVPALFAFKITLVIFHRYRDRSDSSPIITMKAIKRIHQPYQTNGANDGA